MQTHAPRNRNVAILSYHKIGAPAPGGWETWYYISEEIFTQQLRDLLELGYEPIDLPRFMRGLDEPETLPARSALVTFDDAYRNVLTAALPCMRRLGFPGVVFLPTRYVGGLNAWDAGNEPDEPICTWDELRELEAADISVQSHSVSHPAFSDLTASEQEEELRVSKEAIEAALGKPVDFFAYPYGDAGKDAAFSEAALRRAGYRAACLYKGGAAAVPIADRYRLPRLAMGPETDLRAELQELEPRQGC